ncbi:hydroxypyruvate isomerase family protein [Winogradskyella endarachnes]|uniref:TIM barrel protein n=1 Tax=Winogradskyella endarachnes TaxID=2681965 RepID=A0A6L6U6Y0_9FLAO|nr:TIM barrel protein [Winogradskyella endarachnes]MUU78025.1 TIM barrel protein [Winogradskyella endarachnes]
MVLNNNIKHSVVRWPYGRMGMEEFLKSLNEIGVTAIELVEPEDYPLLKKYNIHCAMCQGAEISFSEGWNNPKYHDELIKRYSEMIPHIAEAGYTNLICFSGSRAEISDEEGLKNCVVGLNKILPIAKEHNVVLHMELLNSRTAPHKDYMCDNTKFGVELCQQLDSDNFKLLYDIYHMQVMEGDIIKTIRVNHQYFGHYHTAGNPGRGPLDDTQELNYPAIMKAIVKTGFTGYVGQEFMPKGKNKIEALQTGIKICDV